MCGRTVSIQHNSCYRTKIRAALTFIRQHAGVHAQVTAFGGKLSNNVCRLSIRTEFIPTSAMICFLIRSVKQEGSRILHGAFLGAGLGTELCPEMGIAVRDLLEGDILGDTRTCNAYRPANAPGRFKCHGWLPLGFLYAETVI
jgi:hypothetical protein